MAPTVKMPAELVNAKDEEIERLRAALSRIGKAIEEWAETDQPAGKLVTMINSCVRVTLDQPGG